MKASLDFTGNSRPAREGHKVRLCLKRRGRKKKKRKKNRKRRRKTIITMTQVQFPALTG